MSILEQTARKMAQTEVAARKFDPPTDDAPWPDPLDAAAYQGIAGEVVRIIEPHTEADPASLLVQFLTYAGACIGRSPFYLVESDRHYPNLFAVLVGQSSKARKGTSQGRIRKLFAMIDDPFEQRCIQSGLSSGEGLIWAVRDEGDDDPGVADKRLLIAESEFAGLLRIMTRDGNIVSRVVRDAWDRGDLGVLTKSCTNRATGAHIAIMGHVTADELRRYLDRTEAANGFANRFLFVAVRRSKCLPHGGNLKESALSSLARRLAKVISDAQCIGRVLMDGAASRLWESVYPELSEGQPGLYGSVVGRGEAQVIRLSLLYALLDGKNSIGVDHLRAALALWEYCDASAKHVFGASTGDPVADNIMRQLQESPEGMNRTAISNAFLRNQPASRIDAALAMLASAGRARKETVPTGGRPSERWIAQ